MAGFCVGVVEKEDIIDGSKVGAGDALIAVGSSGPHSNGYSLIRKILEVSGADKNEELEGKTIGEHLLEPTKIYIKSALKMIAEHDIHAISHITGGGFWENIPRVLPEGTKAVINGDSWQWPAIFNWLQNAGDIPEIDLWNTFNMGIGFCLIVPKNEVNSALEICMKNDFEAWNIGQVVESQNNSKHIGIFGIPS